MSRRSLDAPARVTLPVTEEEQPLAKSQFDRDVRDWARLGAERRLVELAEEAAAIHRAFPELRDRHEVPTRSRGAAPASSRPVRRRRRMSAAGRAKLRAALRKRWAAAKKAGKTRLG